MYLYLNMAPRDTDPMPTLSLTIGPLALFAFVASITPGPNNLLLMRSGAMFGVRRSLRHVFGIQTGFVLWVELPSGIDTLALHEDAVRLGLDYVPGALFSASGRYANCLRLNAGYAVTPATETAIRRLGQLFESRLAPAPRRAPERTR